MGNQPGRNQTGRYQTGRESYMHVRRAQSGKGAGRTSGRQAGLGKPGKEACGRYSRNIS